ncbi:MAG: hypothetical protein ACLTBU_04280 [Zhenhengia sp.]|uniref:hypothetical protein n=1 Tax=Zhenhengia sp. TaxID=2944208 RepID=UPI003995C690
MKKKEFIKMLLLGGAVQCDIGTDSLYVTMDQVDGSEIYIYIKCSNALDKTFFGLETKILEYLENRTYLAVLLDGMNNKTYVLDKQAVNKITQQHHKSKKGSYLVKVNDLNNGCDDSELVRFFAEEIKVFSFSDEYTMSSKPLISS